MRFTTEYQPQISKECKDYIYINVKSIMGNNESNIYDLEIVCEELNYKIEKNKGQEILGISLADIKELDNLLNEQVDYIEF
jgi:hypothetical protein